MIRHQLSVWDSTLTVAGKWGFVLTAMLVFSFRADFRVPIAGLLVHPYLVLLPLAFLFAQFQWSTIPQKVSTPLFLFYLMFSIAALQNINPISEIFKVGASIVTFLFFVFAIKSEKDFEWMSWGLVLCAAAIGVQGFFLGEETEGVGSRLSGINVLEGIGNKNAQSLFTLPGVFLGSYLLINALGQRKVMKISVLVTLLFFTVISIFLSANRSGWVGLAIIAISIFFVIGVRIRTIVFAIVLIVISYIAVERYASDIFERKARQTTEGYKSDVGRQMLMLQSVTVGLENPVFGVGMDELHRQMAIRLKLQRFRVERMDTHFLPGYLIGSAGLITLSLFLLFLYRLTINYYYGKLTFPPVRQARIMIIFFVMLFFIRSFFSREILYSPTFISGLGIVFGYYLLQVRKANLISRG
jgi:hypothetical protein